MEKQPLIEMSVFTDKMGDTNECYKTLVNDGIEIIYFGFWQIDAMCTEDYAEQFTMKMHNLGVDLHALDY